MELIIRLILKIFAEVFEADARDRKSQQPAPSPHSPQGQRQGQHGHPQRQGHHGPPQPDHHQHGQAEQGSPEPMSPLEAFMRELQGIEEPQAQPRPQAPHHQQGGPPPGHQQRAMRQAYRHQHRDQESLDEHLRHREKEIARMEQRARDMERQAAEHLGLTLAKTEEAKKGFQLPGHTPLEQLMYAQVILGPCKAQQRQGRI